MSNNTTKSFSTTANIHKVQEGMLVAVQNPQLGKQIFKCLSRKNVLGRAGKVVLTLQNIHSLSEIQVSVGRWDPPCFLFYSILEKVTVQDVRDFLVTG